MSNYSKTTDFEAKDSLPTGDSGKIIRGAEFETEFDAISTAIATKADTAGPTFTGTLTFETISDGTIGVTAFVDEDNMASNSATLVPTQQSVKAYVDSQVTAQDLDFQADTGGALSIDLDSETMTFTGGTGITTAGSGNGVEFAIDSTVATLTGSQTLISKTLTSPVLNGSVSGSAVLDEDNMSSNSATKLATQQSIKAYVDATVAATNELVEDSTPQLGGTLDLNGNNITGTGNINNTGTVTTDGLTVEGSSSTTLNNVNFLNTSTAYAATANRLGLGTTNSVGPNYTYIEANNDVADGRPSLNLYTGSTATKRFRVTDGGDIEFYEDTGTSAKLTWDASEEDLKFADNSKAIFGAGSDLQIYHDSSNGSSVITESGGGDLLVKGSNLRLQSPTGDNYFVAINGGASNVYHGGSVKLATTSSGIDVTGTITFDGGTTSADVNFADNGKAVFGADSDLQIYHDSNNSFVKDAGTGDLYVAADNLRLTNSSATEFYARGISNGAFSVYYDGAEKLATTSTGIDVTGVITTDGMTTSADINFGDNNKAVFGASNDLQIFHDGSNSYITEFGIGDLNIRGQANINLESSNGSETYATFSLNGGSTLYYDNAAKLATTSTGIDVTGTVEADGGKIETAAPVLEISSTTLSSLASINFTSGGSDIDSKITHQGNTGVMTIDSGRNATWGGKIDFVTDTDTRMRINNNGDISFYEDTGTTAKFFWDASAESLGIGTSSIATGTKLQVAGETRIYPDSGAGILRFGSGGVEKGKLSVDASSNMAFETGGSERMTLNSTGLDVTGTVTADGLTVQTAQGDITIPTSTSSLNFARAGSNYIRATDASGSFTFITGANDFATQRVKLLSNGDVALYEDTGTTAKFFWDSSAESLGIGTSSPLGHLHVEESGAAARFIVKRADGTNPADSASIDLLEGSVGGGFGTANNYGFRIALDGADNKLNIISGSQTATNTRVTLERDTGNVGIGTDNPATKLEITGTADAETGLTTTHTRSGVGYTLILDNLTNAANNGSGVKWRSGGFDTGAIITRSDSTAASNDAPAFMTFHTSDDGTENLAERMRIDSSGNLAINRSSAAAKLDVNLGTTGDIAIFRGGNSDTFTIDSDGSGINLDTRNTTNGLTFQMQGANKMRLDVSGNLLVGTTEIDVGYTDSGAGCMLGPEGTLQLARSSANANLYLNKLDNDGEIINFRKDGLTVGSIGVDNSDNLYITGNSSHAGLMCGSTEILPYKGTTLNDGANDIGASSFRWKDLYLSGGVYLGGTGSANKLDDYEEGTWTPEYTAATAFTSITYDANTIGKYTKVGNLVHVQGVLRTDAISGGSGAVTLTGLPFTVASGELASLSISYSASFAGDHPAGLNIAGGGTTANFRFRATANGSLSSTLDVSDLGTGVNANYVIFSGTYITTA